MADKKKAYSEYRQARSAMRELLTVKNNVDWVLVFEDGKQVEYEAFQQVNGKFSAIFNGFYNKSVCMMAFKSYNETVLKAKEVKQWTIAYSAR